MAGCATTSARSARRSISPARDESTTRTWLATGRSRWTATPTSRASPRAISRSICAFDATQPILVQGDGGYSRKGPLPTQASYYYSRPQLEVIRAQSPSTDALREVSGRAWLDHEWSSEYMARGRGRLGLDRHQPRRWRRADGVPHAERTRGDTLWAGGSRRSADGRDGDASRRKPCASRRDDTWTSPRTSITYPVEFDVHAGGIDYAVTPLMDDQELDSRASTGTIYWEGAVRVTQSGRPAGRGYLELTGYGGALKI